MSQNKDKKESKDLSLSELPGLWEYDKKLGKQVWRTTLPLILRDLAPTSGFNPQKVWQKKKEEMEIAGGNEVPEVEESVGELQVQDDQVAVEEVNNNNNCNNHQHQHGGGGGRGRGRKKGQGLSRAEIIQKATEERKKKRQATEKQRIDAITKGLISKKDEKSVAEKVKSEEGQQELLLKVLRKAIERDDKLDAFDILWALEEMDTEATKDVELVRSWRETTDMVRCQLNDMSDRLPPLSKYNSKFKLDSWQVDVLRMIDEGKSVIISAPTSSGKTVISTYVASLGRLVEGEGEGERSCRVLFVVPSEPLVWQVAAHFHKHINNGSVALVTNQLVYSPHKNSTTPPSVVVGTPLALESAMTRIRGKHASSETFQNLDRSQLVGGYDHYDWAVYDEIHALDGPEGDALQRLIRLMNCNFLALSATIGNANELRQWMEGVRRAQVNAEVVDAHVSLKVHESRFMNLQRHVWQSTSLKHLHPMSAVTLDFLQSGGFQQAALPMTPSDSIEMFDAMLEVFPSDTLDSLQPNTFFAECVHGFERMTLQRSKEYEDALKAKIILLSKSHPEETQTFLGKFLLDDSPEEFDVCDMVMDLKSKDMAPCLLFHLNVFELIPLFQCLVRDLEARELAQYPDHYSTSDAKDITVKQPKKKGKGPNQKELEREKQDGVVQNDNEKPDKTQPHNDYSFLP